MVTTTIKSVAIATLSLVVMVAMAATVIRMWSLAWTVGTTLGWSNGLVSAVAATALTVYVIEIIAKLSKQAGWR